jgi:hypothetical protein
MPSIGSAARSRFRPHAPVAAPLNSATVFDTHHARHVDETAHRGIVEGIVDQVADEATVDLQQVDLQALQVAK